MYICMYIHYRGIDKMNFEAIKKKATNLRVIISVITVWLAGVGIHHLKTWC